jgi:hypothetical protein
MLTFAEQKTKKHILVYLTLESVADEYRVSGYSTCEQTQKKLDFDRPFEDFKSAYQYLLHSKRELESKPIKVTLDNTVQKLPILVVIE